MVGTTGRPGRRYDLNTLSVTVYVSVVCIVCWVAGYLDSAGFPVYGEVTATPLWNSVCRILPGKGITYAIGLLFLIGGALLLHRANYVLGLIREKTQLPFLLYMLYISTNPGFFPLKSTSVGVFCLIFSIYLLFRSYHDEMAVHYAYKTALLIGFGSLLWVHLLWFVPLFWIGMYKFRTLNLRTFVASLFGLLTIYWFLFGWCVWMGDYTPFTVSFATLLHIDILSGHSTNPLDWMTILLITLLTIAASVNMWRYEYDDSLRTRQFLSFLMLFAVWSFGLFFLYEQASEEFLQVACVPASILTAHFFTVKRNKYTFWLFHFTVLFCLTFLFIRLWNFS